MLIVFLITTGGPMFTPEISPNPQLLHWMALLLVMARISLRLWRHHRQSGPRLRLTLSPRLCLVQQSVVSYNHRRRLAAPWWTVQWPTCEAIPYA